MRDTRRAARLFDGRRLRYALLALGVSGMLAASIGAAAATAAPITVGSPLTAAFGQEPFGEGFTVFNPALGESGAHATSPVNGTIVSWHIQGAGGPFYLQVLTPEGGNIYLGGPLSAPEVPVSVATQAFTTDMPIEAGQTVGLDNSNDADQIGVANVSGSAFGLFYPQVPNGSSASVYETEPTSELAFNAIVQPLPKVNHLTPRSAPKKGGKKITIKGKNFDGTTSVMFGTKKAKKFKVISDTKITATAPAHKAGAVHVIVLNPGHSKTNSASKFKFKKPAKH